MSIYFEHAIDIARPPDQVFATIEDFSQTPKWLASCTGIERLSPGPNAVGTKLRYSHKDASHSSIMDGQITALVPNERLSFEYADQLVGAVADFRLSASDTGTHLIHSIDITPKTFFAKMFAPLIRLQLPKQIVAAMEALKTSLEAGPS
jgi:uncharacterized protein YndB with AHSA1/START domain